MQTTVLRFLIIIIPFTILAQPDSVLPIQKIEGINFDGVVDEVQWESIAPVPLVQYSPNAGAPPTEETEIRFAYDDKYFYGSIRAFDSDPDGIRGNSLYRDRLAGSDHFEILLDCYNDNESAFIFNTISTGVRTDAAIANDATGGTISSSAWFNGSFNTFWDNKVTRDEKGWYAEVRIPWSSLRFQNVGGNVVMGLSVQRKIARKLERLVFPNIGPIQDWAFLKPSLAQKILIKGVQPTKTVYISPFVLGGLSRVNTPNSTGLGHEWNNEVQREIGADVKFSITNNLTADFTINTDFAQAEADDQQVNLSRFSLFFPEKRQFFQERSGVFEFRTGGLSRLFFSRRIGLDKDGSPIPIIGGARMVGRIGTWDIGALSMQTRGIDQIKSENFGVLRLKRRVFNNQSTIGGIFTSRLGNNGKSNISYGIDGLFRIGVDDFITMNWAQSFDDPNPEGMGIDHSGNGRFTFEVNRRRRNRFGYNFGFIYSGRNFNPGIGFVDRSNFKFGTANASYTRIYPEGHRWIWQSIDFNSLIYIDNDSNEIQTAEIGPAWSFSNRTQDITSIGFKWNYERLEAPLQISSASIPIGAYHFGRFSASYHMAGEKIVRTGIKLESGSFYDGWLNTLTLTPSWFVSKHLELGLQYSYNHANFGDRDDSFNVHIARLRIGTALNRQVSTNAFVQYSSDADLFSANIRFRCNFREGNDLWIVLNEGINTNRFSRTPNLPRVNAESILVKYIHTFIK